MKMKGCALASAVSFTISLLAVGEAVDMETLLETRVADRDGWATPFGGDDCVREEACLLRIHSFLTHVYRVPLCWEWSYIDAQGKSVESPKVLFSVSKGETLGSALDRFVDASSGLLTWESVAGRIWVKATGKKWNVRSMLDQRISLKTKNASAWQALKALRDQLNADGDGQMLRIIPTAGVGGRIPPAFIQACTVHLNVEGKTVRETLGEILNQSPVEAELSYSNYGRSGEAILDVGFGPWRGATAGPQGTETLPERVFWRGQLRVKELGDR